jgi:hypothetical protein
MKTFAIILAAVFFLPIGVLAMYKPGRLLRGFGVHAPTADAWNEVRAVYGGFPIAMTAMLLGSLQRPDLTDGVAACVAAALGGMAAGRLVSAAIDRRFGRLSMVFMLLELAIAGLLGIAA